MSPLRADYRARNGVEERARATGFVYGRYQPRTAREARAQLFANADGEGAEIYQGFEQLYGVEQRDPYAYRPFAEFCLGLPTDLFLRDGERRWLAKQLAKGVMPEEQRTNQLNGRWDSDWHLRIGRRRGEWRSALDSIARDPRLSEMLDVPRLRRALDAFPERTSTDPQVWQSLEMGVPFGLLAARFINFVEGRNDV
jgi:asparagine synthase (glutamine-hydrolysing)